MNRRNFLAAALIGLFVAAPGLAEVESGPKVGDAAAKLTVTAATGEHADKEVDYAGLRKKGKTIYLFIQREPFGRPTARFMKTLDGKVQEADETTRVVAVFLGEKPDAIREYLPKVQQSLNFARTDLAVFTGAKAGPDGWALNPDAPVTATVVVDGKVVANFAISSVNETDVRKFQEWLKK